MGMDDCNLTDDITSYSSLKQIRHLQPHQRNNQNVFSCPSDPTKKEERRQSYSMFSDNDLKKFKLTMESQIFDYQIQQFVMDEKVNVRESQVFFNVEKKESKMEESKVIEVPVQKIVQKTIEVPTIIEKTVPTIIQKQKIIVKQVPVEKIVYEEKLVYVPEIRQKIVQKVVYKDSPQVDSGFLSVIEDSLNHQNQSPKQVIDFVVFLLTSKMKKYYEPVLHFCLKNPSQRFFAQKFLLMFNDETDEEKLNSYLKFLLILYENSEEYFYASDIKVLIDILLRQLEFIRSEFNQYLIMLVFKALAQKSWWLSTKHRKNDIKTLVRQLQASSSHDNQILAGQLLSKL